MRRAVVTGVGVVSPIGSGRSAFFDGLRNARSGIGPVSIFDARTFPTRIAGEVRDIDVAAVLLPERHGAGLRSDRKSVLGLVAAREALRDAFGEREVRDHYLPERIGVSCATGLEVFHLDRLFRSIAAGRGSLLDELGLRGSMVQVPSELGALSAAGEMGAEGFFAVNVSACAAGTQALGEAYHAVRDGVADVVLAGGYDSMVNPLGLGGFSMLEALSTSNELGPAASRPFDARRDGFVLGEGAAFCVIEDLSSALVRKAKILVEVVGYCSSLDAYRVSDPAPDQQGAVVCMRGALADARVAPGAIDYINAHGTGTRKNDAAETAAIRAVFGASADRLLVSSTKSQIGHLIGAAGAVEFVATVFALLEQTAPPTLNLTEPDPACDLDYVAGRARPARVRAALSNSFGFGGQNASIVAAQFAGAGDGS